MPGRQAKDDSTPRMSRSDWWGVVLDAPDPPVLARFYATLLDWEISTDTPEHAVIAPHDGVAYLAFQRSSDYVRPSWPNVASEQQMMAHLDFEVTDLELAVPHALELGASEATYQPQAQVRVLLDPAGHPFCLYANG